MNVFDIVGDWYFDRIPNALGRCTKTGFHFAVCLTVEWPLLLVGFLCAWVWKRLVAGWIWGTKK